MTVFVWFSARQKCITDFDYFLSFFGKAFFVRTADFENFCKKMVKFSAIFKPAYFDLNSAFANESIDGSSKS